MCGIAGLVSPRGSAPDAAAVARACDAIRHRGPDHGAVERYGRCVLGYRRLRVIDLVTGDQPVTNEDGRVAAVLNGEIYGFRALREALAAAGHTVPGTGDTPILPHLYEDLGVRFPERLDGMFALALWDGPRERLVLARDRLGKKPLLWTRLADGSIAFASELKGLLTLEGIDRRVGLPALDAYLAVGYVPGADTALPAVRRVPPGHVLVVEGGEPRVEPYWRPCPMSAPDRTEAEWVAAVRAGVLSAVRKRLVADVPLGALLSGGIDSSVVVAAMAQSGSGRVRTFSVGFAESRYDERRYARLVAERLGTEHEEIVVEPDAASLLPRLAETYDEPFADSSALPTFLVCEHARRFVTVALGGDGGDETFGGYERYRAHALAARLDRLPAAVPRMSARALRLLPSGRREPRSPAFRAARFLETSGLDAAERYGRLMEIFPAQLRAALWSEDALAELGAPRSAGAVLGPPRAPGLLGLQLLDLETYLPGDLLVKADLASMASSLELRSPLLDHELVELGLGLPERLKTHGSRGKVALRQAFAADLPEEVLRRGKRGFGVPVARWFREELRELAGDTLLDARARGRGLFRPTAVEELLREHAAGEADHGARLWSLVMLELWHRAHVDGAGAARTRTPLARAG
jgi:asparagine synthase (glutamine-hydrolysing)